MAKLVEIITVKASTEFDSKQVRFLLDMIESFVEGCEYDDSDDDLMFQTALACEKELTEALKLLSSKRG